MNFSIYLKQLSLFLLACCFSQAIWAQVDVAPKATAEAMAGRYYAAGLEAESAGDEYKKDAAELFLPDSKYPKALICYVSAAEYFKKAEKKYGKGVAKQKESNIKKAEEVLAICKRKSYKVPASIESRLQKVKNQEEDEEDQKANDEKTVKQDDDDLDMGGRVAYFKTEAGIFAVTLPSPLEAQGPFGGTFKTHEMKDLGPEVNKIFKELSATQMNSFSIKGYQVSASFKAYPKTSIFGKAEAGKPERKYTKNDRTYKIGSEQVNIGSYTGKLNFHSEWEIDNPNQSKEDIMATFETRFMSKTHIFIFNVGIRNLDDLKVYKKVESMVRSLREVRKIEAPQEGPCKPNTEKLLSEYAMKVSWRIPHPKKRPFFIQQPVLERGKVPGAWSRVSTSIVNAIKLKKSVSKNIKAFKDAYNGKYVSAAAKRLGWASEHVLGIEFIPIDFSQFKGGLSNAVIFYLQALSSSAVGISKVGDCASSMSMDIYWEIPYIEVYGFCYPRMVCKKGKWVPDYSKPVYREVYQREGKLHASVKENLSMKGVRDELEKVYLEEIKKIEESEIHYKTGENKCRQCMAEFYSVKWPGETDMCDYFKGKVKNTEEEIRFAKEEKARREQEKKQWEKEKPVRLKELNDEIALFDQAIAEVQAEIKKKEKSRNSISDVKRQHELNSGKNSAIYKQYVDKEKKANDEIRDLRKQELSYTWTRNDKDKERMEIQRGAVDDKKKAAVKEVEDKIKLLEKQKQSLRSSQRQFCK